MDEPSVTDAGADDHVVRATASATVAGDWSLVLTAAGINHRVVEGRGAFWLVVSGADVRAAIEALSAFDAESVPKVVPPAPDVGPSVLGVLVGASLLAMFAVTGPGDAPHPTAWFAAGAADAAKILHGNWWRVITALTLHADVMHVVGNVIATLIFVSAVGRWLGAGLGALLIVGSAALANWLTALWHRHEAFVSMGASTATFAAIGVVAGLQLYRRWRYDERRRYFWLPLGAGLALFAMLGTSQNADFGAHLFGLLMGTLAGSIAAAAGVRAPGRLGQALLSVLVSAVLIGAWMLAFRASGLRPG